MTRSGRAWGEVNAPPIVPASERRGGYTILSAITPSGELFSRILDTPIDSDHYIEFLRGLLDQYPPLVIVLADHASFHRSHKGPDFVRAHRQRLRLFFFPRHAPHLNPDEPVWNEIKYRQLARQPIVNKQDLLIRLRSSLDTLKDNTARILSFFHLADTRYVLDLKLSRLFLSLISIDFIVWGFYLKSVPAASRGPQGAVSAVAFHPQ